MFDGKTRVNVMQCTYETSLEDSVVLSAVLGSCLAVCAHDPIIKVGGMNHIVLPGEASDKGTDNISMYGTNLMELLFNDLFKKGARKNRLELKIFGGAKVIDSTTDAGTQNIAFIEQFVSNEGLNVISSSTGGTFGRRLEYHPVSGRSRQKILSDTPSIQPEIPTKVIRPADGELELF